MPFKIKVLTLPGHTSTLVFAQGYEFPSVTEAQPFYRSDNNTILRLANDDLLKICHTHSTPKNQLQRSVGRSRARVEASSNRILNNLGVSTGEILAVATCVSPFSPFDSALIMKRIRNSRQAFDYLNDVAIPDETRKYAIDLITRDLRKILCAGFALRDFSPANIMMVEDNPMPVWIDNDAKRCLLKHQLVDKFTTTLTRFPGYMGRFPANLAAYFLGNLTALHREITDS